MKSPYDLNTPLSKFNTEQDFLRRSHQLSIHTLNDIMQADLENLKQHKDFSYTWYADILTILKSQNLLNEFQKKNI